MQNTDLSPTIDSLFRQQAQQRSDDVCVVEVDAQRPHQSRAYSYAEMARWSAAVAGQLQRHGVCPGQHVGLVAERGAASIAAMLGILSVGASYLPVDPAWPHERLKLMFSDAAVATVLQTKDCGLDELASCLSVASLPSEPTDAGMPGVVCGPQSPAYVMYTSGSSGQPKGVVVPHAAVLRLVDPHNSYCRFAANRRFLHIAPLAFDASTFEIWGALLNGGCCVVVQGHASPQLAELGQVIRQHAVTTAWLTSSLFNSIVNRDVDVLNPLDELLIGGEALSVAHVREAQQRLPATTLINGYGPTENTTFSCCYRIPRPLSASLSRIPIGAPIHATQAIVVDEQLQPVDTGQAGELVVLGQGLALGYLNQDELTEQRFVEQPDGAGVMQRGYRTGDVVRELADGTYDIIGRLDEQVKIDGHRIEPAEIEATVLAVRGVRHACVQALPNARGQLRLVAHVQGQGLDQAQLRKALSQRLPGYLLPHRVQVVEDWPLTANGKLDRRALVNPFCEASAAQNSADAVAQAWAQVLGHAVGADINFMDAGGTSLDAVELAQRLGRAVDQRLTDTFVFEHPTMRAQRQALSTQVQGTAPVTDSVPSNAPIAVVGMACRMPGAQDVGTFWNNLLQGRDSVSHFSEDELDASISLEQRRDPAYVRAKGVIEDCDQLDAEFFGIPPMEARVMDPQQRVALQLAWHALEDAGIVPGDNRAQRTGVFAGMNWGRYYQQHVLNNAEVERGLGAFNAAVANESDFLASRISYKLDLTGPSVNVYTACSTGLVAIAQACAALQRGECERAIAGGVSISTPLRAGYRYQEGGMLSADGVCRPFDSKASGTTFNDGAGFVVLKTLAQAQRDGDRIHAVVRGCAVNNDGANKASFTAPSVEGQVAVYREALSRAGLEPQDVGFIECHGTATPLGDPIEIEALSRVYGQGPQPCLLGAVKSNIGHTIHAAGVAGFIKAVLSVREGQVPATVHFSEENPRLGLTDKGFEVNAQRRQWSGRTRRRAAVSSLGVGGTNAHVVLEQYVEAATSAGSVDDVPARAVPVLISAPNAQGLERQIASYQGYLAEQDAGQCLRPYAQTAWRRRKLHAHRAVVRADTVAAAATALAQRDQQVHGVAAESVQSGFLFSGQGTQQPGMGGWLYAHDVAFRALVDDAQRLSRSLDGPDLQAVFSGQCSAEQLQATAWAQPALFVFELGLARHLMRCGVQPDVLIGHSIGEFAAAVVAEVFSFEDALKLVIQRGALMQRMPAGAMLAVRGDATDIQQRVPEGIDVAAVNAPQQVVLAGPQGALAELAAALQGEGFAAAPLNTSHAFHSAMMAPVVADFEATLSDVPMAAPRIPIVSTSTGQRLNDAQATSPAYWAQQLRRPVLFAEALRAAHAACPAQRLVLAEVGPGQTLSSLVAAQQIDALRGVAMAPDAATDERFDEQCKRAVDRLWTLGWAVDYSDEIPASAPSAPLPGYAFAPQRHWLEPVPATAAAAAQPGQHESVVSETATDAPSMDQQLRELLEDVTGLDMSGVSGATEFLDAGLDSLLLTQVATALERRFHAGITFRDLVETYTTIDAVCAQLQAVVPAAQTAPASAPQAPKPATARAQAARSAQSAHTPGTRIARDSARSTLTQAQQAWVDSVMDDYVRQFAGSKAYTQKHRKHLADPRSVSGFNPAWKEIVFPIVVERSKGSSLWDVDGNRLIDTSNGFGPILFGHSPDFVTTAVFRQLDQGIATGPQSPLAGEVAALFCELTGHDRCSFASTGSEAVLGAIRLARTVTGRDTVVMFEGSYHGIVDEVLVRPGRDAQALPSAPGVPREKTAHVRVLPWGDPASLDYLRDHAQDLAAVLVEPVQSRRPDFHDADYLKAIRAITAQHDAAMIVDEVVTGFRVHPGGLQQRFGFQADLATYGKVAGGGYPIGLIGGSRRFMDALDGGDWSFGDDSKPEAGVTFFAGTFVRHPVALAACHAVLSRIREQGQAMYHALERKTDQLAREAQAFCTSLKAEVGFDNFASLFYVKTPAQAHWGHLLFTLMTLEGIHIQQYRPNFLTTEHSDDDVAQILNAFRKSLALMVSHGLIAGDMVAAQRWLKGGPSVPQGARLGKNQRGEPAYFLEDPQQPGRYIEVGRP